MTQKKTIENPPFNDSEEGGKTERNREIARKLDEMLS